MDHPLSVRPGLPGNFWKRLGNQATMRFPREDQGGRTAAREDQGGC